MTQESNANVIDLSALQVACRNCTLFQLCLPIGLSEPDLARLEQIIKTKRYARRGDYIFRSGDPFRAIYAVKAGSVKTVTIAEDGREQVTGFHLPGELFGLDAIAANKHGASARALERTTLCEIPFASLEHFGEEVPTILRQMLRIMSREIERDHTLAHLGNRSAEERLAAFLISISNRYRERGFAGKEFHLTMSRSDIGNYLGLAVETVSRLFTRFQQEELLIARSKHIRLLDVQGLNDIAGDAVCPGRSTRRAT
jgi:CRP/FNR family transcriptional regulator